MASGSRARVIQLQPTDNVCVAVTDLEAGSEIDTGGHWIRLSAAVPMGHKIATCPIGCGEPVRKYGQIIGHTTQSVAPAPGSTHTISRCTNFTATTPVPRVFRRIRHRLRIARFWGIAGPEDAWERATTWRSSPP